MDCPAGRLEPTATVAILEEALQHADRITVMRDGVVRATEPTARMTRDKIVRLMVGRDVEYARHGGTVEPGVDPVLEIDNVTMGRVVQNMSFSAYAGRIVVLAGLVGAGRTETAMIACGELKRRRIGGGEIRLNGKPVRFRTPREAIRHAPQPRIARGDRPSGSMVWFVDPV